MDRSHPIRFAARLGALVLSGVLAGAVQADSRSAHFQVSRDATVTASATASSTNFATTLAGGSGTQAPAQSSAAFASDGGDPAEQSTQIFRSSFD